MTGSPHPQPPRRLPVTLLTVISPDRHRPGAQRDRAPGRPLPLEGHRLPDQPAVL